MRKLILFLCVVMLSACGLFEPKQPAEHIDVLIHPDRPRPITALPKAKWQVVAIQTDSGTSYYRSLTPESSKDMVIYLEDVLRYIKSQNKVLCFYRVDLTEVECMEYSND